MKTTEFELSKRLDGLGLKRKSSLAWMAYNPEIHKGLSPELVYTKLLTLCVDEENPFNMLYVETVDQSWDKSCSREGIYPAYTLDEVLEMLPREIDFIEKLFRPGQQIIHKCALNMQYRYEELCCGYIDKAKKLFFMMGSHNNPAEAAGLLLEWCIKEGYVKVEELNKEQE